MLQSARKIKSIMGSDRLVICSVWTSRFVDVVISVSGHAARYKNRDDVCVLIF